MIELLDLEKAHAFLMKAVRSRDTETTKGEDYKHYGPHHPDWDEHLAREVSPACYNFFGHIKGADGERVLQPGCLIGTAFYEAGVMLEWMEQHNMEHSYAHEVMSSLVDRGMAAGCTTRGSDFLSECQSLQDAGKSWGEAIAIILKRFKGDEEYLARELPSRVWGTEAEVAWIREYQV